MSKSGLTVKLLNEKQYKKTIEKDFPDFTRFAVANTASRVAYLGMELSEKQMKHDFNLRNKFLVGSSPGKGALKFNRAIPHHDLRKIESSWGSPEKAGSKDYSFLEDQEEGFKNESAVPSDSARISKSYKKKLRKINYINKMRIKKLSDGPLSGHNLAARVAFFTQSFKEGFGLPGSNQFFYLDDNEYAPGWSAGFYQFSRKVPPKSHLNYPNIRRLYYTGKTTEKNRRAVRWMERSKNKITQNDIDKIYADEFKKAFTRQIKRRV